MDGFTGLNIEQANTEIQDFMSKTFEIKHDFEKCFKTLFEVLNKKWASSNAKSYTNQTIPEICELHANYWNTILHIIHGACDAANYLAEANGASFTQYFGSIEAGFENESNLELSPCNAEINGAVGMDLASVKMAVEFFSRDTKTIISKLNVVPKKISFYDANGDLLSTYDRNVTEFIKQFSVLFDKIERALRLYLQSEQDNILLAKENATNTMSA